jgi:hypothetical protein
MTKLALKERKTKERRLRDKLTPKQDKVVNKLLEDIGKDGERRTLGEIMEESGYSKAIQKNPQLIIESPAIQNKLKQFIDKLEEKRDMAINAITPEKIKATNARDLASIADVFIKNTQLLGGNATERIVISDEERDAVDKAFMIEGEIID